MPHDRNTRLIRARLSLDGLSVGDAFGQQFFGSPSRTEARITSRTLPAPSWPYTDDTEMALAVVEVLERLGHVDQDLLAALFARRYVQRPNRGYGGTAHGILQSIGRGDPWKLAAQEAFDGTGSMGNGGAMRVGPIGAYFADDLNRVVEQAHTSAQVTHAHPEGQAGAIAVAVAVAMASRHKSETVGGTGLLQATFSCTPPGVTRDGIALALTIPLDDSPAAAAAALGNGSRAISSDTVPFCLWCAARHLEDYEAAMWTTVSALGDRDTTCAITGSIVVMSAGWDSIPASWLEAREPLC